MGYRLRLYLDDRLVRSGYPANPQLILPRAVIAPLGASVIAASA